MTNRITWTNGKYGYESGSVNGRPDIFSLGTSTMRNDPLPAQLTMQFVPHTHLCYATRDEAKAAAEVKLTTFIESLGAVWPS